MNPYKGDTMFIAVAIRCLIGAAIGAVVGYLLTKTPVVQNYIMKRKLIEMERQTETMLKIIKKR